MKPRSFKLGPLRIVLNDYRFPAFATDHGPRALPWYKPFSLSMVLTNPELRKLKPLPLSWNVWFYTRWGSWCHHVAFLWVKR